MGILIIIFCHITTSFYTGSHCSVTTDTLMHTVIDDVKVARDVVSQLFMSYLTYYVMAA